MRPLNHPLRVHWLVLHHPFLSWTLHFPLAAGVPDWEELVFPWVLRAFHSSVCYMWSRHFRTVSVQSGNTVGFGKMTTKRGGEIISNSSPGFLYNGDIKRGTYEFNCSGLGQKESHKEE